MSELLAPPQPPAGLDQLAATVNDPQLLAGLAAQLIEGITSRLPDFADDPDLLATLDEGARVGLASLVQQLSSGRRELTLPAEILAIARTLARRGSGTEPLLTGFSSIRQSALAAFTDISSLLAADPAETGMNQTEAWSYLLWLIDATLEVLVAEHGRERDLVVQSRTARRMDTIRDLLAAIPLDTDAASTSLGYPLLRHHTAVVGWVLDSGPVSDARRQLRVSLATWAAEHFRGQTIAVPSGSTGAWAWLATHAVPELRSLSEITLPAGTGIAVGTTGYGAEGFRRSHQEAMLTQRIVRAGVEATGVHLYDDVEIAGLAGADPDGMRALVRRELGALADDEPALEKLRGTLLAYYSANQQLAPAAEALGVHKNTVRYRLQQAEEVLGRPLGERRAKVELALHCLKVYGADAR